MNGTPDFALQLLKMSAALVLVLGLLYGASYGLRRLNRAVKRRDGDGWIEILAQRPVGLKHHLVVAAVQEQRFLLGISPEGIQLIAHIEGQDPRAAVHHVAQPGN
jgi:flagellar protein FliO/FliZ